MLGARLNSEWVRMWKETAAASYKGLTELTNIIKIVSYTHRFFLTHPATVSGLYSVTVNRLTAFKKPTSSTGRHGFVRVDELSPIASFFQPCFLSRFTTTYLLCLTSTHTWSSYKSLSCPVLHISSIHSLLHVQIFFCRINGFFEFNFI